MALLVVIVDKSGLNQSIDMGYSNFYLDFGSDLIGIVLYYS
jgi:hypothetical protein